MLPTTPLSTVFFQQYCAFSSRVHQSHCSQPITTHGDLGNEDSVSNLRDVTPLPASELMPTIAPNLTMTEGELPQELLSESEFDANGIIIKTKSPHSIVIIKFRTDY
jgi:hypothetical protein